MSGWPPLYAWQPTLRKHADTAVRMAIPQASAAAVRLCAAQQGGAKPQGDAVRDLLESLMLTNPKTASTRAVLGLKAQVQQLTHTPASHARAPRVQAGVCSPRLYWRRTGTSCSRTPQRLQRRR